MAMFKKARQYDLTALSREVTAARAIQDFSEGAYGHCISLPGPDDLTGEFRDHHNNVPFADALSRCPLLRAIFDGFQTEKASFRLLRRAPQTAYGLHDDRDKGMNILRFQIPIISNPDAMLCVMKDGASEDGLADVVAGILEDGDLSFDFERFRRAFGAWFELYSLEPGYLYHFDTNRIHTAINAGAQERIVLGIDLVVNEWLREWMRATMNVPVAAMDQASLPAASWEWNSLGHGLITHPKEGSGRA